MSNSTLFLYFLTYSIIGWISEVLYCSVIEKRFVARGFLRGPLCPIYGFGGLLVVYLLDPFKNSIVMLFFMAILITTLLEYISSWLLETIFNTKWWDYSRYRFNIHGRVCLLNSILFGFMGVIGVLFLHPFVESFVMLLSEKLQMYIAIGLFSVFIVDVLITLRDLVNFADRLALLGEFMENVRHTMNVSEWYDELDLSGSLERLRERIRNDRSELNLRLAARLEFVVERSRSMRRLMHAFPGMQSKRHSLQLDVFKKLYRKAKKLRNKD
ncbi:MAG TPA: putative ABC transporter permease [Treponemataceae bacterium]|nr:putative ABC transporter permease [Treponemataceae bacterium]